VLCNNDLLYQYRIEENLAGENFGKFGDLLQICQSFIRQLFVISEKVGGWA